MCTRRRMTYPDAAEIWRDVDILLHPVCVCVFVCILWFKHQEIMFGSVKKKPEKIKASTLYLFLHFILYRCDFNAMAVLQVSAHSRRHVLCHHVGFSLFNSFMLFMFFPIKGGLQRSSRSPCKT